MINDYKRTARSFREVDLGDRTPLDQALPELSNGCAAALVGPPSPAEGGPKVGQRITNQQDYWRPQGDSNPCYSLERAVSLSLIHI